MNCKFLEKEEKEKEEEELVEKLQEQATAIAKAMIEEEFAHEKKDQGVGFYVHEEYHPKYGRVRILNQKLFFFFFTQSPGTNEVFLCLSYFFGHFSDSLDRSDCIELSFLNSF